MIDMHVALASDQGYVCGLVVTAASLAMNVSREAFVHFHVLDCGITDEGWEEISDRVTAQNPNVDFERILITEEMLADFPKWHGGKSAYARLFLPNLLKECEYVIYCDVDFLWLGDALELWLMRDANTAMIAVKDAGELTVQVEAKWHREHNLAFDPERYFCSGLCFMNLSLFRRERYAEKTMAFISEHQDLLYPDQAALNYVLRDVTRLVDGKWQRFSNLLTLQDCEDLKVIHYAGDTPWRRVHTMSMLTDVVLLWHAYYARIYGISLYQSLRKFFSFASIVYRRVLWLVSAVPATRACLIFIARIAKKQMTANYFKTAYVPIEYHI